MVTKHNATGDLHAVRYLASVAYTGEEVSVVLDDKQGEPAVLTDITTEYIVNPSFEADGGTLYKVAPRGWQVSSNTEWWGVNRGGGNGDPVATDGAHIFGVWDGRYTLSPSISQTINGLPVGNYTLTVDMHVSGTMAESRLGTQCLFAGDESVRFRDQMLTCGTGDNFPMQTLVLHFSQQKEKTPITIGVRTEGAPAQTWFKIDNFRLYATIDEDFVPTRITSTGNTLRVVAIEMFDLSGRRISRMQRGVNIVRMKMEDGNVKIEKIIK